MDNTSLLDHHLFTLKTFISLSRFLFRLELSHFTLILYKMESSSLPFWHYLLILIDVFLGHQNLNSSEALVLVHWLLKGFGLKLLLVGLELLLLGEEKLYLVLDLLLFAFIGGHLLTKRVNEWFG